MAPGQSTLLQRGFAFLSPAPVDPLGSLPASLSVISASLGLVVVLARQCTTVPAEPTHHPNPSVVDFFTGRDVLQYVRKKRLEVSSIPDSVGTSDFNADSILARLRRGWTDDGVRT